VKLPKAGEIGAARCLWAVLFVRRPLVRHTGQCPRQNTLARAGMHAKAGPKIMHGTTLLICLVTDAGTPCAPWHVGHRLLHILPVEPETFCTSFHDPVVWKTPRVARACTQPNSLESNGESSELAWLRLCTLLGVQARCHGLWTSLPQASR
jgi:hypothetical protein